MERHLFFLFFLFYFSLFLFFFFILERHLDTVKKKTSDAPNSSCKKHPVCMSHKAMIFISSKSATSASASMAGGLPLASGHRICYSKPLQKKKYIIYCLICTHLYWCVCTYTLLQRLHMLYIIKLCSNCTFTIFTLFTSSAAPFTYHLFVFNSIILKKKKKMKIHTY